MDRKPPVAVRRALRQEVGFGCPVPGCGSPYLTWHHFDPPWSEQEHHDPQGMIAICRDHHPEADQGAFTREDLHAFKEAGRDRGAVLEGRFNWMRRKLLAVVGGSFFLETPIIVQLFDHRLIWFSRDDTRSIPTQHQHALATRPHADADGRQLLGHRRHR
jgi:hypothetical protein